MLKIACVAGLMLAVAGCGGGDGAEVSASGETTAAADPAQPDLIAYFMKFPTDKAARAAIPEFEELGFAFNPEYTAAFAEDGQEGWLVVERGDAVADIENTEDVLSDLAEKHGGIYDGWEAGVG